MNKANHNQIFNFGRLNIQTKVIGSMIPLVLMVVAVLIFMRSAAQQLEAAVHYSEEARLAQEVNANFQLAVSKGKNVCILRDDKNKERALRYMGATQKSVEKLQALAESTEEKAMVQKLSDGVNSVDAKIKNLVASVTDKDKAEDLYGRYLKDITIDFDNACDAFSDFVSKKAEETQGGLVAQMASGKQNGGLLLLAALAMLGLTIYIILGLTRNLRVFAANLQETADQVTSASGQVANSSQQLSEGASESASSLEETSSSLEEMSSMTKQNAENASRANQLMEEARQAVLRGNESVESTVQSMREMQESAEKVSRIIKTIEEIAFQTNLLALNAAVEAARAGEHGRGFAVVAEEVRSLAQRSAVAAKDTASLIEENALRVSGGVKVSEASGKALTEIVDWSKKISGLLAEVATASQEQSKGIEEISVAITQMDKVTQRNSSNAEELSSSSEELSGQAQGIRDMVDELVKVLEGENNPAPKKTAPMVSALQPVRVPKAPAPKTTSVSGNGHKGNGRDSLKHPGKFLAAVAKVNPEEVIPLGPQGLKDF
jgi:methyl-accepting chemotaxis protein